MIYSGKVPSAIKSLEAATEFAFFPHTMGPPLPKTWCNEEQIDYYTGPSRTKPCDLQGNSAVPTIANLSLARLGAREGLGWRKVENPIYPIPQTPSPNKSIKGQQSKACQFPPGDSGLSLHH